MDLIKICDFGKFNTTTRANSPKIGKNKIYWRKILIFDTKYPTNFRSALGAIFLNASPLT